MLWDCPCLRLVLKESYLLINVMLAPTECVEFVSGCFSFFNSHFDGDFVDAGQLIVVASLRIKQKLESEGNSFMNFTTVVLGVHSRSIDGLLG